MAAVLLLTGTMTAVAYASTDPTNITIAGGTLNISSMTVGDFAGVTLSGSATNDTATMTPFTMTDARGLGSGWNVTVQATQFSEYSGGYVPSGRTLAVSSLSMPQPTVAANGTSSGVPTITSGPFIIDSGSAVKIASAATDNGMGAYNFTQGGSLTLSIPANAYAASYRSEVTVSAVSGP
ncbi:MAG: WxL domain-containing protein [Thermoleophilia bacterium]|nr:WxL domain-containing protein [Thermoleophilia bacterium]